MGGERDGRYERLTSRPTTRTHTARSAKRHRTVLQLTSGYGRYGTDTIRIRDCRDTEIRYGGSIYRPRTVSIPVTFPNGLSRCSLAPAGRPSTVE
jgi:hypothetical protein